MQWYSQRGIVTGLPVVRGLNRQLLADVMSWATLSPKCEKHSKGWHTDGVHSSPDGLFTWSAMRRLTPEAPVTAEAPAGSAQTSGTRCTAARSLQRGSEPDASASPPTADCLHAAPVAGNKGGTL